MKIYRERYIRDVPHAAAPPHKLDNFYDIAILYPPESFIGQFVFGDIMEQLSGERLFYFFNLADVFGRRLQVFVCFGMRRHEVGEILTVSGLLAAVMSSMKPCLTPLFTQSAM